MTLYGYADARFARVTAVFDQLFGGRVLGGGALAVYQDGVPVLDIWGGTRDADGRVPWTESTGTMIYSASKGLSAIVIHRLVDRGLISYDAAVADYWPEFAEGGKHSLTVRDLLRHRAGLSQLRGLASTTADLLDHDLIHRRIAAARPDRFHGISSYHALTFGWTLSGLASAVTGLDMRELYQRELCDPLGITELSLGRPASGSPVNVAALVDPFLAASVILRDGPMAFGTRMPGPLGAMTGAVFAGTGTGALFRCEDDRIFDAQMPAANAVATARSLARVYAPLATDGTVDGARLLSRETLRAFDRRRTWHVDRALGGFMSWHLGFHRTPLPGLSSGFGHVGINGSFGWADPASGLSVGFVHNRLPSTIGLDLGAFLWLLPALARAAKSGSAPSMPSRTAA